MSIEFGADEEPVLEIVDDRDEGEFEINIHSSEINIQVHQQTLSLEEAKDILLNGDEELKKNLYVTSYKTLFWNTKPRSLYEIVLQRAHRHNILNTIDHKYNLLRDQFLYHASI